MFLEKSIINKPKLLQSGVFLCDLISDIHPSSLIAHATLVVHCDICKFDRELTEICK